MSVFVLQLTSEIILVLTHRSPAGSPGAGSPTDPNALMQRVYDTLSTSQAPYMEPIENYSRASLPSALELEDQTDDPPDLGLFPDWHDYFPEKAA